MQILFDIWLEMEMGTLPYFRVEFYAPNPPPLEIASAFDTLLIFFGFFPPWLLTSLNDTHVFVEYTDVQIMQLY